MAIISGATNPDRIATKKKYQRPTTQLVDIGRNRWSFTSAHLFRANSIALPGHVWSVLCTYPAHIGTAEYCWFEPTSLKFCSFPCSSVSRLLCQCWEAVKGRLRVAEKFHYARKTGCVCVAHVAHVLPKSASGFLFAIFAQASVFEKWTMHEVLTTLLGYTICVGLLNSRNSIACAIDSFIVSSGDCVRSNLRSSNNSLMRQFLWNDISGLIN